MPTFYDPGADAGEASEALCGLAHATRSFENPQDLYGVLGDLLSGVRSLKQVLDQLATAHVENRPRAFDDHGDHAIGSKDALAAADELHQAATFLDQAEERLDAAASAASRVAWREVSDVDPQPVARWISVVFLQGQEADEVLDMIDADGTLAGLNHLKYWDFGDETTSAAMENGYVYDVPPSGPLEREVRDGDYPSTSPCIGSTVLQQLTSFPMTRGALVLRRHQAELTSNDERRGLNPPALRRSSSSGVWDYEPR